MQKENLAYVLRYIYLYVHKFRALKSQIIQLLFFELVSDFSCSDIV